jgi:hypothetical protein
MLNSIQNPKSKIQNRLQSTIQNSKSKICLPLSRRSRKAQRRTHHAGAAKRVGGLPNARKLPRNELDKGLAKCHEIAVPYSSRRHILPLLFLASSNAPSKNLTNPIA